jgi:hypothetical protein
MHRIELAKALSVRSVGHMHSLQRSLAPDDERSLALRKLQLLKALQVKSEVQVHSINPIMLLLY